MTCGCWALGVEFGSVSDKGSGKDCWGQGSGAWVFQFKREGKGLLSLI